MIFSTIGYFCSPASFSSILVVSVPKSVFSLNSAIRLTEMFFFFSMSLRNSKKLVTNKSSCGVVRKNHLKLRWVSVAEDDSGFMKGMPLRSATWLAVFVTLLK